MTLSPGEVIETAIWLTGEEPTHLKDRFEKDLRTALAEMADSEGVIIGPLLMEEKKPGEDRVPEVPKDLHGLDVTLLVGTATVVDCIPESNFIAELEPKDLERLRMIARRGFRRLNPDKPELSIERCDEFINQIGPEVALAALRERIH